MERKRWIAFLPLFVSFSSLLISLVSISSTVKIKDEVYDIKLTDFASSTGSNVPQTPLHGSNDYSPRPNLHIVSKGRSVSNTLMNHAYDSQHYDFQENVMGSILQDSSMKYAYYRHKQLKNINVKRKQLKIAVPIKSTFKQFVEVSQDGKNIAGFSIDVFQAAVRLLPYKFIYQMIPFNGSYDDLLKEVAYKNFDAAVGDIVIKAEGYQLVEFSQPYVEAGLSMVVKTGVDKSQPWWLFSLFTPGMWFSMAAMSLFTGFVIWFIEHQNHEELGGSPARPFRTVMWIFFTTLYLGQRETPNNNLSHFVLLPWLFLMLVVSATFSSSLTSILTNSHFAPSPAADVNELKKTNAMVASDGSSFVNQYLVKVLGFKQKNIRSMASNNEYAKALSTGEVEAAFILTPYAKVFLAKYCKGFAITGPNYKLGGFGFVFQKGSALALDMSQAILKLNEGGEVLLMEEEMLSSFKCSASLSDAKGTQSLGPTPFLGLFIVSGGASVIALLITLIRLARRHWNSLIQSGLTGGRLWSWLLIYFTLIKRRIELQPAKNKSIRP